MSEQPQDSPSGSPSAGAAASAVSAQNAAVWKEKAGAFFSSSSLKIKAAAGGASEKVLQKWQSVQPRMAEAATKASSSVAEAADSASIKMKSTWQSTRENWNSHVAPRVEAGLEQAAKVAADTGSRLKMKARVVGQQMSDITQQGIERSKLLLGRVDWKISGVPWQQQHTDGTTVFGVPLEVVVSRPRGSSNSVPLIIIHCCNFILQNGLSTEYIFEMEGDAYEIKRLMRTFDSDTSATIPDDADPLDVAQLLLVYLKCLPEPIFTFELYDSIAAVGGSNINRLCQLLRTLPAINLATMHAVVCLLYRVSLHADVNKMDAQSLAAEFAPVLLWPKSAVPPPSSLEDEGEKDATAISAGKDDSGKDESVSSPSIMTPSLSPPPPPPPLEEKGVAQALGDLKLEGDKGEGGNEKESDGANSVPVLSVESSPLPSKIDEFSKSIPLDDPLKDQTSIVEAIMCLIEDHESIFSHSPGGPILLSTPHL